MLTIDGNEAAARIAYQTNEVIAIYPITPASPMDEWADEWASRGQHNLLGVVPEVVEMQSEGGAAGATRGALQGGALASGFTASQGLLLMIPNMYKIAGELTPTVLHVAARSIAAQALSIFGDHTDVMSARMTGYAMLCSASVQEALDFALVAQMATLRSRVPFLHFFDGFRTSHEINKIADIPADTIRELIDEKLIIAHRQHHRAQATRTQPGSPGAARQLAEPGRVLPGPRNGQPLLRGHPGYRGTVHAGIRRGHRTPLPPVRVSRAPAAGAAGDAHGLGYRRRTRGSRHPGRTREQVGLIRVRLYRPFSPEHLLKAIPPSVQKIAVLDRTKEPGADGEPLYKDVATAIIQAWADGRIEHAPRVTGGRYGLSSKEFTPGMVAGIFDELNSESPRNHFTVGIHDDVSHTSLPWDPSFRSDASTKMTQCVFFGLGSDGTVSANKNSIKIIGETTDYHVQGYFQYDSKKAGAVTVSHLRFGPEPIESTYLIEPGSAQFVACHQPNFIERYPMLEKAAAGATFLLNSPHPPEQVWDSLPREVQQEILDKKIRLYAIDAYGIAQKTGMGRRINTIMQTAFFAISGILDADAAITRIKTMVEKTYGRKGRRLLERNYAAIDASLSELHRIEVPGEVTSRVTIPPIIQGDAPAFVKEVTATLIAGRGDDASQRDPRRRHLAAGYRRLRETPPGPGDPALGPRTLHPLRQVPIGLPTCRDPLQDVPGRRGRRRARGIHARAGQGRQKGPATGDPHQLPGGAGRLHRLWPVRGDLPDPRSRAPEHKAINMVPVEETRAEEEKNWDFFVKLPEFDRRSLKVTTLKGAMAMQPLFEFSGACVGCGETPYIKLATQLFGDRMLIANATGCSSIYGGNLPTTPYTTNPEGRGPAWNNSLFEDNAKFGLGMRTAVDAQTRHARELLERLAQQLDSELVDGLLNARQVDEADIHEQRERVARLKQAPASIDHPDAAHLLEVVDYLVKKSVWLIGGDGWAYDIGYGGLDHVLASGKNVNILVLDTEVYSNTGGQTSKAAPLGAVAKFSAGGKPVMKKDLAMMAMAYGNVYVAQVALGSKDVQTLRAFIDAESYDGPSLIIAYSPCIAHGVDLSNNLRQQDLAVNSGHWSLFRYDPCRIEQGESPLHLDSKPPSIPYEEFANTETRFAVLSRTHPDDAQRFLKMVQQHAKECFHLYEQLAHIKLTGESKQDQDSKARARPTH